MAYYKRGNAYLDEDESVGYSASLWGFWLFILGAYFAGNYVHGILPEDWPKELRFASVVLSGGFVGSILAYFSVHIQVITYMVLTYSAVAGLLYLVWTWV